jgi:hypothetical protein
LIRLSHKKILNTKDHLRFINKLEENPDSEEVKALLQELKDYEEKQENSQEAETRLRSLDDPKLEDEIKKIEALFDDPETAKHLGKNQVNKFKDWCMKRVKATPSLKTAKETLELVQNHSTDGIKPRAEFYRNKILPFLSKYGLNYQTVLIWNKKD